MIEKSAGSKEQVQPSPGENGNRVVLYDWVRLLATILVVVGHSAYLSIATTYGGVDYSLPANLSPVYGSFLLKALRSAAGWVYQFHMPLFFMLSGAVLRIRPLAPFDQLVRAKVKRLLIPYFFWGWAFMLPVKRLGNFYDNDSFLLALKGFLSGVDSGHLWFLTALFWCILVFCILAKLLGKLRVNSIYALLLLAGALHLAAANYLSFDLLGLKKGLTNLFYFAIGYFLEGKRREGGGLSRKALLISLVLALLAELINGFYSVFDAFFAVILGCFLIYLLAEILSRLLPGLPRKRFWPRLMRNLFYVYIFHDPLEYLVLRISMQGQWLTSGFGCVMFYVCRTVVVFAVSLFLGELVSLCKNKLSSFLTGKKLSPV